MKTNIVKDRIRRALSLGYVFAPDTPTTPRNPFDGLPTSGYDGHKSKSSGSIRHSKNINMVRKTGKK